MLRAPSGLDVWGDVPVLHQDIINMDMHRFEIFDLLKID